MKTRIFILCMLVMPFCTVGAQTLDQSLLTRFDPATVRELYAITRSTTLLAEQQMALAARIEAENTRFTELLAQDNGLLTLPSEAELVAMRDASLREILTEEQLLDYFRRQVDPEARARGKEVLKAVSQQLKLSYMELKYIDNTFFKIEQDIQAARMLYKDAPAKAKAEAEHIYAYQIAQLELKSGIRVDKNLKATRVKTINDYAPVTE